VVDREASLHLLIQFFGVLEFFLDDLQGARRVDDNARIRAREGVDGWVLFVELDPCDGHNAGRDRLACRPTFPQQIVEDRQVEVRIVFHEDEGRFSLLCIAVERLEVFEPFYRRRGVEIIADDGVDVGQDRWNAFLVHVALRNLRFLRHPGDKFAHKTSIRALDGLHHFLG
jgi:hypothetical protein